MGGGGGGRGGEDGEGGGSIEEVVMGKSSSSSSSSPSSRTWQERRDKLIETRGARLSALKLRKQVSSLYMLEWRCRVCVC